MFARRPRSIDRPDGWVRSIRTRRKNSAVAKGGKAGAITNVCVCPSESELLVPPSLRAEYKAREREREREREKDRLTNCPPEEPQTSKHNEGNGGDALIEPTALTSRHQRDNGNGRTDATGEQKREASGPSDRVREERE